MEVRYQVMTRTEYVRDGKVGVDVTLQPADEDGVGGEIELRGLDRAAAKKFGAKCECVVSFKPPRRR